MVAPVGPPWSMTMQRRALARRAARSRGSSARSRRRGPSRPPGVGERDRLGARDVVGVGRRCSLAARSTACVRPVCRSSRTSASGASGEPPKKATKSPPTRMSRIVAERRLDRRAAAASRRRCRPGARRPPSMERADDAAARRRSRRCASRTTHCGTPNSAAIGQSASTSPARSRYRFHQPLRSETKCSSPAGDQAGWKIDSARPPATWRGGAERAVGVDRREPEVGAVPRHVGWSQVSHASCVPSGLRHGLEQKSWPLGQHALGAVGEVDRDQRVDRLAAGDRRGPRAPRSGAAARVEDGVGEAHAARRGQRDRRCRRRRGGRAAGRRTWLKKIASAPTAKAPPPYSWTRLRTFQGAAIRSRTHAVGAGADHARCGPARAAGPRSRTDAADRARSGRA